MKHTLYCKGKITIYDGYEVRIGDIDEPEEQEPFIIPHEGVDSFINNPSQLEEELRAINSLVFKYLEKEDIETTELFNAFKEAKEERGKW